MFGFYLNMKIHLFSYYHLRLFSFKFSVIFICLFVFICSDFPFFVCLLFSVVRLCSIVKIFSVVQSFAVFVISCHFQVFGYFYFFSVVWLFPIGGGGARGGSRRRGRGQHLHRLQATARGRGCRWIFFLWSTFCNHTGILKKMNINYWFILIWREMFLTGIFTTLLFQYYRW